MKNYFSKFITPTQYKEEDKYKISSNLLPSVILCSFNLVVRLFILYKLCSIFGLIFGFCLTIFTFKIFQTFVKIIFKLDPTNFNDNLWVNDKEILNCTVACVLTIEDFDKKEIKKIIKKKVFDIFPKISASLVTLFGELYWNTPQIDLLSQDQKDEIFESRVFERIIEEKNLKNLYDEMLNKHPNPFICPIEFHIIGLKDSNTKGYLLVKATHAFSDGLGFIAMLGFIDTEFSLDKYSAFLKRTFDFKYYFYSFIQFLQGLIYGLPWLINMYTSLLVKKENKYKSFVNKTVDSISIANVSTAVTIDLEKIKHISKKTKVTVNDLMVYLVMRTLKKVDPNSENITVLIPIGFSNLPTKTEEVVLKNRASGIITKIKLPGDNDKNLKCFDLLNLMYIARFTQILFYLLSYFPHFYLAKFLSKQSYPQMTLTNVPGHVKNIKLGKSTVVNMYPLSNAQVLNIFCAVVSYSGKINVSFSIDKANEKFGIYPERLNEILLKTYDELVSNYS